MTEEKNYFQILNDINVSDKTEEKNGLKYLSWAYAWGAVKKLYPDATYKVYETAEGCIYWNDGKTAWVKTGVTIEGLEHIEYLPVLDYKNKSITVAEITSFNVNSSIQRSLTKAIARHGLGLYIYAGEDLPEEEVNWKAAGFKTARERNTLYSELEKEIEACGDFDMAKALESSRKEDFRKIYKSDEELGMRLRDALDAKLKEFESEQN